MKDGEGKETRDNTPSPARKTSMGTLVTWNVSKALESNPHLDLRVAIRATQEQLEQSRDLSSVLTQTAAERHLACAVLAWQQLGHSDADSLYRFVAVNMNKKNDSQPKPVETSENGSSGFVAPSRHRNTAVQSYSMEARRSGEAAGPRAPSIPGPVLKLPVEPKVVMRLDAAKSGSQACRPVCKKMPDVKSQIESACCMDSSCTEKLQAVDKATQDLRARATQLAQREADRVALLERAEAAWRDLEAGYERRLHLAEEKETEIESQVAKLINERNDYKSTCSAMVDEMSARTDAAEKQRAELVALEKEVCGHACERASLSDQAAYGNTLLAEELCRAAQLDRELLLKEEQARRKLMAMESEAEAAQALTHEAERALHGELCALKAQMEQVARELLLEDEEAARLKNMLNNLLEEREDLTQDLESCTMKCDGRMKAMVDSLKAKREELAALRLKEMDCHCKLPVDVAVEVKRTPSLAALCHCSPVDRLVESCSCTSLRSRLLSNLLSDLFAGLQSEMNIQDTQMPCQLLKCLEDRHNWDRSTAVKTRLRDFFSKLLLGELDIAIATSIEKYHAKWVGESCADAVARLRPPSNSMHTKGWQERALELKAQKMATQLAEQLFKEKAKELAQQAKDILAETGRPPCECHPATCCPSQDMFPCLVGPPKITNTAIPETSDNHQMFSSRAFNDVTKLKIEIENLKKDIIKRDDLNLMEQKIAKMVQLASVTSPTISMLDSLSPVEGKIKKDIKNKPNNIALFRSNRSTSKSTNNKRKDSPASPNKLSRANCSQCGLKNCSRSLKRPPQQFAVNLCLFDAKKKSPTQSKVIHQLTYPSALSCKQSSAKDNISGIKQLKPLTSSYRECDISDEHKIKSNCVQNCICFHKKPSNTSIDKLLETLTKWKMDLVESPVKLNVDKSEDTKSLVETRQKSSSYTQNCEIGDNKDIENILKEEREGLKTSSKNIIPIQDIKPSSRTSVKLAKDYNGADMTTELPVPTESEYMGAINLEKSAENSCKCEYNENIRNSTNKYNIKFPFKCIYSAKCVCKDCESVPIRHEQGLDTQSFLFKKCIPTRSKTMFDRTTDFGTENFTNTEMGDVAKPSFNNVFKCPVNPLPVYDNHIKCLGVTLANISTNKKLRKPKNMVDISYIQNMPSDLQKDVTHHKDENTQLNLRSKKKSHRSRKVKEGKESVLTTSSHDHYSDGKRLSNEDQLDINTSETEKQQNTNKPDELKDEPCICCKKFDPDDSKDLEVNTFQLLEEHLKGKLEEFKHSFCIPNAEEEKIFTAILRRIKQLISESTSNVACKCVGTKHVNGSWNRAYNLLQEYLRTKIERVKCQCDSDKINNKSDAVLPNILKNISYLIENDFQRLKEICKCKSANATQQEYNEKSQDELKSILLSEANRKNKEPVDFEHDYVPTSDKQDDGEHLHRNMLQGSKSPDIFSNKNISAQVSLYPSMETRSCEAMKKDSHYTEVQTIEDMRKILSIDSYNNARSGCDCYVTKGIENTTKQLPGYHENIVVTASPFQKMNTELFPVNTLINCKLEKDMPAEREGFLDTQTLKSSLPYIGYTMNCTCDKDLGCVCTKSTVRAANDRLKIKDIWKKNTNKKVAFPDISYILNSTDKLPKTENCLPGDFVTKSLTEVKFSSVSKNSVRDSQISASNENGINLKKSKEKVDFSNEMTNTVNKYKKSVSDNKVGGSFKNRDVVLSLNHRKSEHLSVMKQNKEDDSYSSEYILCGRINSNQAMKNSSLSCDCKRVPICHVKMLVASIEDKLANAQCTCDSLSSKVCPVHSKDASK